MEIQLKYGRLTPVKRVDNDRHGRPRFLFRCDCGKEKEINFYSVKYGTVSCGCYKDEVQKNKIIHGKSRRSGNTKEYVAWMAMKNRVLNPKYHSYHRYGGRGISIHQEWINSFESFLNDVGEAPDTSYTFGRIDNNRSYSPGNVRWETRIQQNFNKVNTLYLEFKGEAKTTSEWSEITGISAKVIRDRIRRGWSIERSLTKTPHTGYQERL